MKKRFTSYSFWISLSSAVVVLFEAIGRAAGFIPDGAVINNIIMAIAGILVVLGVVSMPNQEQNEATKNSSEKSNEKVEENEEKIQEETKNNDEKTNNLDENNSKEN